MPAEWLGHPIAPGSRDPAAPLRCRSGMIWQRLMDLLDRTGLTKARRIGHFAGRPCESRPDSAPSGFHASEKCASELRRCVRGLFVAITHHLLRVTDRKRHCFSKTFLRTGREARMEGGGRLVSGPVSPQSTSQASEASDAARDELMGASGGAVGRRCDRRWRGAHALVSRVV